MTVTHSSDEAALADLSAPPADLPSDLPSDPPAAGAPARPATGRAAATPEVREQGLDVPPMWRRLTARLLDILTVGTWVFALAIAHIFLHIPLWSTEVAPEPWGTWFLTTVTFTICYAAYEITFIAKTGSTPGKDLMNLVVQDATTGARPTWSQATRRWFLPGIVQPIPGAWIGGVLTTLWGATSLVDSQRRAVHDRLAGTRVASKALPATQEEREARRKQFLPRFIDPFAVYRAAKKGDHRVLHEHPSGD